MSEFYEILTRGDRRRMRENQRKADVKVLFKRLRILHKKPVDRIFIMRENAKHTGQMIKAGIEIAGKTLNDFDKARMQMGKDLKQFQKEGKKYPRRPEYDY